MEYIDKITKKSDLNNNDSITTYDYNWDAQQNHNSFETFFYFIKEVKPNRIIEIGTSKGGFTYFLKETCNNLNLDCQIISYDIIEYPWYSKLKEIGVDLRIKNIFNEDYTSVKQEIVDLISSDGITVVLCDGGNKKLEFNTLSNYLKVGDFILGHDYATDINVFNEKINKKIWNWLELTEGDIIDSCIKNNLVDYKKEIFESVVWTCRVKINQDSNMNKKNIENSKKITLVTGLWDIKRGDLKEGWSRPFSHYLEKFDQLLKLDYNLIIFGDSDIEEYIWERRNSSNTQFCKRSLDWFKQTTPFDKIQEIRNDSNWFNQTSWLPDSTQAKLEWYNPLVMSKMFLLNDASILDKFESDYLFWIDAGLTNTVHPGYFTHDKVLDKLPKYISKFSFVCFPYEANTEIHGFEYNKLNEIAGSKVNKVARGGFFGGPKDTISEINTIYYGLLSSSLNQGYMGTEESIFSIMCYRHSDLINYFEIEGNGLMGKFFEDLKNDNLKPKSESSVFSNVENNLDINKVGLYVITFNSPKQFEVLIQSMLDYDRDFIDKPKKFLLDNSTDLSTTPRYQELCEQYKFEHIKKDNIGIVGGRVFVAEHFDQTGLDFCLWFEDDMAFYNKKGEVCRNGFNRYVPNLYQKILEITKKESFDFLKLNFSEFYGDNSVQFSWYNVPQEFRKNQWPNNPKLPEIGLDPNAPKTKFENIKIHKGLPYATGEIYLSNWPIILTKKGNYKCYLETKWSHPYEQTLMSYAYQETIKGKINPGILLLTPTEHHRFDHYAGHLRKES